jgi:hypothetical protein
VLWELGHGQLRASERMAEHHTGCVDTMALGCLQKDEVGGCADGGR